MADMKELLPCPFCGSEPYIAGAAYFSKKLIMCNVCGAEHSIEKWNTRAPSKQLTQTQQALDRAVEALEFYTSLYDCDMAKAALASIKE